MLLEFTVRRDAGEVPAYILISQITDLAPNLNSTEVAVGLRAGRAVYVKESMADILDAMSYATRHISTTPGIVDKIDGEHEEVYPWRRREKVTELAAKWRNYTETMRRGAENEAKPAPKYTPTKLPPNPIPPWLEGLPIPASDVPPEAAVRRSAEIVIPVTGPVTEEEAKAAYAAGKPVTIAYDDDDARPVTERQMEAPPAVGDWRDAEREAEQIEIDKMNAHDPRTPNE